ncbi:disease resistance protein RPM1-like [Pyrus ussuriensis x Pyrus communis]|uniref:Disease resistance protein RPM1-like n=1 Tax=Pyrus ussuriensis x Pyrus communis TaxID=2448454 RepID=A0A5N5I9B7_9ROSA|nr:disease resistance protein RPM1-like [Pyrus ussuriensis x Pyrus communis]
MAEFIPLALVLIENSKILNLTLSSDARADVERANKILGRMQAYLTDCSSKQIGESSQVFQNRAKEIQDVVYDIEDALSMFLVKIPHHYHSNLISKSAHHAKHYPSEWKARRKLLRKLKQIESGEMFSSPDLDSLIVQPPIPNTGFEEDNNNLVYHEVVEEDEIVGFETAITKLIQQLREEEYISQRPLMISIVGPGGSGKTTLVKNVYERRSVQAAFDFHAFVDVPRSFQLQTLLLTMLRNFEAQSMQEPVAEDHNHREETYLRKKLRQILEKKKYLVVLDNVWSEQDLRRTVNALPKGLSGSKIITTTQDSNIVASWHASSDDYIHDLSNGLSSQEANKLFCKKAFHGNWENCPEELEGLAQIIISDCGGLPLAISTVGTFLARQKPQTFVKWKKFHDSFSSNLQIVGQAWEPSYRDLPDHLKSCFLYFSMFPEDSSIKRERLIRLWVAEGFVKQGRGTLTTMEEVADGYLNQLIGRKLVDVSSREIDGQVRSCRVSNLVRKFIKSKAESFVTVLESNNTRVSKSSSNSGEKIRRLSAHYVSIKDLLRSGGELNQTRTLLVFGPSQQAQCDEVGRVLNTLKYLRVLDLKGIPLEDFPKSISGLILLKYVSMRKTKIKTVPSSINRLAHLETLDLKRTRVTKLPEEICKLYNMRHLLVSRGCDGDDDGPAQGVEVSAGNIGALSELQKLSLIKVGNNRTILNALAELTGLRKLGLTDLKIEHGTELCCAIEKMGSLSTLELRSTNEEEYLELDHHMKSPPRSLERLSLKGRLRCLPQWVPMLHSVVKISLKWSKLDADANPLKPLQALRNMMELHLVCYYTGQVLEFKAETFMKLKILSIKQFDQLHTMKVESGAMPNLEKLTLSNCKSLNLPPLGMEGLRNLEELFLHDMPTILIAKLQRDGEDRQAVERIPVIHSFNLSTGFQNLSQVIVSIQFLYLVINDFSTTSLKL